MNKIKEIYIKSKWIGGISDGLTLQCYLCKRIPKFDFTIEDSFWNKIVPKKYRLGIICLPCLDKLATEKGENVAIYLERIQFTGIGKTILLKPEKIFYYKNKRGVK